MEEKKKDPLIPYPVVKILTSPVQEIKPNIEFSQSSNSAFSKVKNISQLFNQNFRLSVISKEGKKVAKALTCALIFGFEMTFDNKIYPFEYIMRLLTKVGTQNIRKIDKKKQFMKNFSDALSIEVSSFTSNYLIESKNEKYHSTYQVEWRDSNCKRAEIGIKIFSTKSSGKINLKFITPTILTRGSKKKPCGFIKVELLPL